MKEKITIDIVSDVACPWCFVGKKHVEAAMRVANEFEYEVRWHPFMLDPNIPQKGRDFQEHFTNKFGSMTAFNKISYNVLEAGKNAGIHFQFEKIPTIPNTLNLHKILHIASDEGIANQVNDRLLQAYFEEPVDLTKKENLSAIMSEFGWTDEKTNQIIGDNNISEMVLAEISTYQQRGINSVPFFIINEKYGLSGAQPSNYFVEAFREIGALEEVRENLACDLNDPNC